MYNLYHIKGVKWGCTNKTAEKRVKEQGYSISDVCEIVQIADINEAADMERQLNIRDGYTRDPNKYNQKDYSSRSN
jgi:hypothetical protein